MTHILQKIVNHKRREISQRQQQLSLTELKQKIDNAPEVRDFVKALQQNYVRPSIIAEVKKASPSKGVIRHDFEPTAIAKAYERGGASCLSVLTDSEFFQGSFENLQLVRSSVSLPLLCKEFVISPYQIYLARHSGADAVLLIAAILSDSEIQDFLALIHFLGMNALIEVHTLAELDRVLQLKDVCLLGINNRNLEDFSVNLSTTQNLIRQRQQELNSRNITLVSESGIKTTADLNEVAKAGAKAVLIGESFMRQTDVERALKNLLQPQSVA